MAVAFESIRTASESIAQTSNSVNDLAVQAREAVDVTDSRVDRVADEAVAALEEFQGAIRDVRAIIGDPALRQNLEASLGELPAVLRDAQTTLESAEKTFQSFERVGDAAVDTVNSFQRTADNIQQITQPFADRSDQMAAQLLETLGSLDRTLAQVESLGSLLNASDGSLKRFLEDDEIYWRIRRTVENIEDASARVRPILDDVRIFTDKVARDPRQLGVRGAISKRPSGLGVK
jgi:phospholipid/cholesterol/gamma-HCH transport system substrate-binding protein